LDIAALQTPKRHCRSGFF